jgi:hypothetical protein
MAVRLPEATAMSLHIIEAILFLGVCIAGVHRLMKPSPSTAQTKAKIQKRH